MKPKTASKSVRLEEKTWNYIDKYAEREGFTRNKLIEIAIIRELKRIKKFREENSSHIAK